MNVIAWLMLGNILVLCIVLWTLYDAKLLAESLEDMQISYTGRMNHLLEQLLELQGKKHDRD